MPSIFPFVVALMQSVYIVNGEDVATVMVYPVIVKIEASIA